MESSPSPIVENPEIRKLYEDIYQVLDRFAEQKPTAFATIIGTLDLVKLDVMMRAREE